MKCKCGLNPNNTQSKEQRVWEKEYIVKYGMCSACKLEEDECKLKGGMI